LPAASINALAQLLIPPPKYPVQRLVPGVRIATTAKVKGVFIIHRSDEKLEWLDPETTLDIVLANTEDAYGFPPYHTIENFLLNGAPENLREIERQIIAGALENASSAMIPSRSYDWAGRIPALIELIIENRVASVSAYQAMTSPPSGVLPTSADAISDLSD
jgi:dolichol-phosphate mannosyltransferase